ncbi:hypothetical protein SC171_23365 [Pantoea cypripedii]|uniref:hypothetical protein n=1 Tax=Pantoea cypripedii TaxID=55209 RepID=UPI002FCBA406
MTKPKVSNIACTWGEIKGVYSEASGFAEVIERESMLKIPDMWGWGYYYATEDIYLLAQQSIKQTLNEASISPDDVDLVIFCAASMPGRVSDLNARTAMILKLAGINRAKVVGQTLGGCATLLSSMIMAGDLVTANVFNNVMVVAIETLPTDLQRFDKFAIYSDASVSFLVSSELHGGFEIIASTYKSSIEEILNSPGLQDPALSKASVFQTLGQAGIQIPDIKKVFSNNTFLPVKMLRERSIGFTDDQIDISNIASFGHCFSCDSMLNYYLYQSSYPEINHEYYLLFAEADGHSASVLIK